MCKFHYVSEYAVILYISINIVASCTINTEYIRFHVQGELNKNGNISSIKLPQYQESLYFDWIPSIKNYYLVVLLKNNEFMHFNLKTWK